MKPPTGIRTMMVLGALVCQGFPAQALPGIDQSRTLLTLLAQMESSYARVKDYTAVFHKQERLEGVLLPEETILLKFQKPLKVYMKWIKDPYRGREALYVQGDYDNKVIAHQGGILRLITLSLDPRGATAMEGNRHPITEIGFGYLLEGLRKDIDKSLEHGDLKITRIEQELFRDRLSTVVEARSAPRGGRRYYASRMVLHVDKELELPVGSAFYDEKDQLFERYVYTDVRLNVGLSSTDFSRHNAAYHF
jgi:outer membrane lipoprotein-sorting protein